MTKADAPPAPLTKQQETAAVAIGTGSTVSAAARQAKVARQTVSGWLHRKPSFKALVEKTAGHHQAQVVERTAVETATLREAIAYLQPTVVTAIAEALAAQTYILEQVYVRDAEGNVVEKDGHPLVETRAMQFPAHRTRLSAARLYAHVRGEMIQHVEHSGEVALRTVSDEDLDDSILRLERALAGGAPRSLQN